MVAVNSVGPGKSSPIARLTTLGTFPAGPADTDLLALNSSWVGLHLDTWSDGDCPISSFVIEYSTAGTEEWHLVSNNVVLQPGSREMFTIYDLAGGSSYSVRITAHNSAGSSVNTYHFSTLPAAGPADTVLAGGAGGELWSSWSLLVVGSLCLLAASACVYLSHLALNKLIHKKAPREQENNLNYDHQYQEMRQLQPQENILQLTPVHTTLDKYIIMENNDKCKPLTNSRMVQSSIYADPTNTNTQQFTFYQPFYHTNTWVTSLLYLD